MKKRVSDIACAIEPYDKVWGVGASGFVTDPSPFERINLILDDTEKTTNGTVYPDRLAIMTRVFKETEGEPQVVRTAKAMAAVFRETPIQIYEHELLVGSLGCPKKGAPVLGSATIPPLVRLFISSENFHAACSNVRLSSRITLRIESRRKKAESLSSSG